MTNNNIERLNDIFASKGLNVSSELILSKIYGEKWRERYNNDNKIGSFLQESDITIKDNFYIVNLKYESAYKSLGKIFEDFDEYEKVSLDDIFFCSKCNDIVVIHSSVYNNKKSCRCGLFDLEDY